MKKMKACLAVVIAVVVVVVAIMVAVVVQPSHTCIIEMAPPPHVGIP